MRHSCGTAPRARARQFEVLIAAKVRNLRRFLPALTAHADALIA
jgi:hypothetical protein